LRQRLDHLRGTGPNVDNFNGSPTASDGHSTVIEEILQRARLPHLPARSLCARRDPHSSALAQSQCLRLVRPARRPAKWSDNRHRRNRPPRAPSRHRAMSLNARQVPRSSTTTTPVRLVSEPATRFAPWSKSIRAGDGRRWTGVVPGAARACERREANQ
jgi:hypothetical protein